MTTFLLTNNPTKGPLDFSCVPKRLRDGKRLVWDWSVHSHKLIQEGDEVFWIRLGPKGRGIFGRGEVTRAPYLAPHRDRPRSGEKVYYVNARVLEMVDPEASPVLPQDDLKQLFPKQQWSPQSSGIRVHDEVVPGLRRLWRQHCRGASKVVDAPPTADPEKLKESVRKLVASGPVMEPVGVEKPKQVISKVRRFLRDPRVQAHVLLEAKGKCECCGRKAPFHSDDGVPFLEVHHLRQLAQGGPDTARNAAAVCPNCHRELHHGKARRELVARMRSSIARLRRTR